MDTIDQAQATARVVDLFRSATRDERDYGLTWYVDANAWAAGLAADHSLRTDQVAGIAAALSQRIPWRLTREKTVELIETGETYGLKLSTSRARRILDGDHPDEVLAGPKVRSFFDNLAHPSASDAVTIDRHAVDAAAGAVLDDRTRKSILERKGGYERVADIYRAAARILGVAPHVVQSVVWAVWRNRYAAHHRAHQAQAWG